ncbi:hypothetical protein [Eubacterium limosum]|uniref:hypothetical protein n=1 Tax=Eubacterium limosum TaxID=1736 RepID=UPI0010641D74|nr:hypothetical protein [Eubacterium limosum]
MKGKQIVNFISSFILILQIVIFCVEFFSINSSFFISIGDMLNSATIFWNVLFLLFIFSCFMIKKNKIYGYLNLVINTANIILLNKLYKNEVIIEKYNYIKSIFLKINLQTLLLVGIFCVVCTVLFLLIFKRNGLVKKAENYESQQGEADNEIIYEDEFKEHHNDSNAKNNINPKKDEGKNSEIKDQPTSKTEKISFWIIFVILLVTLGAALSFLPNILIQNEIIGYSLASILLCVSFIFIGALVTALIARRICAVVYNLKNYINNFKNDDDAILRIVLSFGVMAILLYVDNKYQYGLNDFIDRIVINNTFLVYPVMVLVYLILSYFIVMVALYIFKSESAKKIEKIIKDASLMLLNFCDSILNNFIKFFAFIPDFINSLEFLLLGIEDKHDDEEDENEKKG